MPDNRYDMHPAYWDYIMESLREGWSKFTQAQYHIHSLNNFIDHLESSMEEEATRLEEEVTKEATVVPLKLLNGGRRNPPEDWLSPLTVGTTFVVNPPDNDVFCLEFEVVAKGQTAVEVGLVKNRELVSDWVNPVTFCKKFSLVEILG
jgi:hypothetical protein